MVLMHAMMRNEVYLNMLDYFVISDPCEIYLSANIPI